MLTTLKIAWRNLGRNRKRTVLAVSAIALGQLTLVFVNCMMAGMFADMLDTITGPLLGHAQIHHKEWREERAVDLYVDHLSSVTRTIAAMPDVKKVLPRIYAPVLVARGEKTDEPADAEIGMVVGIDVDCESGDGGLLEALSPAEYPGQGTVVVGRVLAKRLGIRPGSQLAVIGQDVDEFPTSDLFEVKAVIRSMTDVVNRLGIVMPMAEAGRFLAMPDQAHEIIIHGDDPKESEVLAASIAGLPGLKDAEVLGWRQAAPELVSMMDMKDVFDLIFVAILFVAAAAGIANTMTMSTFERTHEFGMLLAIGSRPWRVVGMVFVESITLGLVGVAIGSILGTALVLITSYTGIDYAALTSSGVGGEDIAVAWKGVNISYLIYPRFEWRHIGFGLVAVTATSVWAALWPAFMTARLQPVEAMRS
jgi:ABC-type lipoprotein release transport system permease subunit